LKVERGVLTEVVGEVVKEDGLVACVEGLNGPIGFGQWYRWNGGCDFDGLPDGRKRVALLSRRGEGLHAEQKRYGKQRFMDRSHRNIIACAIWIANVVLFCPK
jgi:hypothetical protein